MVGKNLFVIHPVRLLTNVLWKPTRFFYQLFIATLSNSLQTSFNSVLKDWPDKYHVCVTSTRIVKTHFFSLLKGTYIHVLLQNTCHKYRSYHILLQGIHFVSLSSTYRWSAYVAGNSLNIKTRKMKHAYNKDKTRSIILKRYPKADVLRTYVGPENR